MGIKATKLIKVVDDMTDSDDGSSGDEGEGEAEGVGDGEDELASQAESETEEPPTIQDETEEEAAQRIKSERTGKITFSQAKRLKDAAYRKKVIDAAKQGHLPAQVRRYHTHDTIVEIEFMRNNYTVLLQSGTTTHPASI